MRQRLSCGLGLSSPLTMPLMPAMRPLASSSTVAARPISKPPIRELYGVKAFQLIVIMSVSALAVQLVQRGE